MAKSSDKRLAKLTIPRLYGAVPRTRLFDLFQQTERLGAVWLAGPPGSGKTTAVATYLDVRGRSCLWTQLDEGDRDPATLFFYLVELGKQIADSSLPYLTPEYLTDVAGFARRFFRQLYAAMPRGMALVFDNYQTAACDQINDIFCQTLTEAPQDTSVFIISRSPAPNQFSRLIVNGVLHAITWDDLRLTADEAAAILQRNAPTFAGEAVELNERTNGWVAGLRLMTAMRTPHSPMTHFASREAIFDYLAGEIFDRATEIERRILVCTAVLPHVSPEAAVEISGDKSAARVLERLYKGGYFTDRRTHPDVSYRYHDLFREFLLHRAKQELPLLEQKNLFIRAAQILERGGSAQTAIDFLLLAEDFSAAAALVLRLAPSMLAQGRFAILRNWIASIPNEVRAKHLWLDYWHGVAMMQSDLASGREMLAEVYRLFGNARNPLAQSLCAAAIINSIYFEYDDFGRMDPWLSQIERALRNGIEFPEPSAELHAYSALLLAVTFRQPDNCEALNYAHHIVRRLAQCDDVNAKVSAALSFLTFSSLTGQFDIGKQVIAQIRPLVEVDQGSALNRAYWWLFEGYAHHLLAEKEQFLACYETANRVSDEHGINLIFFSARTFRAYFHACFLEHAAGKEALDQVVPLLGIAPRMIKAQYHLAACCLAIVDLDPQLATQHARLGAQYLEGLGAPFFDVVWRSIGAVALVQNGEYEEADRWIDAATGEAKGHLKTYHSFLLMCRAYRFHCLGQIAQRNQYLTASIQASREGGEYFLRWLFVPLSEMFSYAFEETDDPIYLSNLVLRLQAPVPGKCVEAWPWPVKLYTLGRFEIYREGQQHRWGRKTPKKALELLKAILAFGNGVSAVRIEDQLWPDQEGDAAHNSFSVALHRLRHLLGSPEAVELKHQQLFLNPQRVWVDAWAFERWPPSQLSDADRSLDLYKGAFLPCDIDVPLIESTRERLRTIYVKRVCAKGRLFEESHEVQKAFDLYQNAIGVEAEAEELYQGFMRCSLSLDRCSEGERAFRQLQKVLHAQHSKAPANATQELARLLKNR